MPHLGFVGQIKKVFINPVARHAGKRERRNKLCSRCRQQAAHAEPEIAQPAHKFGRFVSRDAATDYE